MKTSTLICVVILCAASSCTTRSISNRTTATDYQNVKLVGALKDVPVDGAMVGPYKLLTPNNATSAIVAKGEAIVPTLIAALDRSSWQQTVWIVFCLRELDASSARPRIEKLRKELRDGRFSAEARDATLEVGLRLYLRNVH